jgi:hypothetical protein
MKQLQGLLPKSLDLILEKGEISIYKGTLSANCVIQNTAKIKNSFPSLPEGFYKIFSERILDCGFTDDRLNDSVNNVIDTCIYPTPTIAQFISWDMKIKVLTYENMLDKTNEFGGDLNAGKVFQSQYKPIQFPDREKPVWVHVDDIKRYHLESL